MPSLLITLFALVALLAPAREQRPDLFDCEGCESIHEYGKAQLSWSAVIPPAGEPGERLVLTGRVLKTDGRTPAPGVIVYVHHTNAKGLYPRRGDEQGWGQRHGYLRAWVKSNDRGEYRFETIRPGTYPTGEFPAHIHFIIKEPDRREYWIDDVVFTDDPLVTDRHRSSSPRGGNGVVTPKRQEDGTWTAQRDIVLEP